MRPPGVEEESEPRACNLPQHVVSGVSAGWGNGTADELSGRPCGRPDSSAQMCKFPNRRAPGQRLHFSSRPRVARAGPGILVSAPSKR